MQPAELWHPAFLIFSFALALSLLVLGRLFMPFSGESYEWAQYIFLGLTLPLALIGLRPMFSHVGIKAKAGMTGIMLLWLAIAAWQAPFLDELPMALCFALVSFILSGAASGITSPGASDKIRACSWLILSFIAWSAAERFFWWGSFASLATGTVYNFSIVALMLAGAAHYWSAKTPSPMRTTGRLARYLPDLAAVVIMLLAASAIPTSSTIEQDFFIGPAALVKMGAHLLWDVPSQYGFFNILLIAAMPFSSMHMNLYVVNGFTLFVIQAILYALLRARAPGSGGVLISLMLAIATIFQLPSLAHEAGGPLLVPSSGGLRYLPCYIFIGFTWWNMRASETARSSTKTRWLVGSILWAVACLWSSEVAIYASSIWLPQCLGLSLLEAQRNRAPGLMRRVCHAGGRFVATLLPLLGLVALVSVYYLFRLGHAPDWYGFFEYALAYQGGLNALPIEPIGAIWWLILLFSAIALLLAIEMGEGFARAMPLCGLLGLMWSTTSYFIGRSAEGAALALVAPHLACIAALLAAHPKRLALLAFLRPLLIPLTAVVLSISFASGAFLKFTSSAIQSGPEKILLSQLPQLMPEVKNFLAEGGYKPGDALTFINDRLPSSLMDEEALSIKKYEGLRGFWLPLAPPSALIDFDLARQQLYLRRFVSDHPSGGWLLTPKAGYWGFGLGQTIVNTLSATHRQTSYRENEFFVLRRFDLLH